MSRKISEQSGTAPNRKTPVPSGIYRNQDLSALPPPSLLAGYENVCPGTAERIIHLAEQEAEHRRMSETAIVQAGIAQGERESVEARRGQIFALIIVVLSIGGCIFLAVKGHELAASALGLGAVGSVVTTFIIGRGGKNTSSAPEAESMDFENAGQEQTANHA